jgi:hypothetical protein
MLDDTAFTRVSDALEKSTSAAGLRALPIGISDFDAEDKRR